MYDPQNPAHTTLAAQALYIKLQKLSEDIQLQHSILNAQKETVLKSRQKIYLDDQKNEGPSSPIDSHAVHAHADTVIQHRAMIHKHYDLIRQHKAMVKEQGLQVQNLATALLNLQQETTVVDELMTTRLNESNNSPNARAIEYTNSPNFRMFANNDYNNDNQTQLDQGDLVDYPCSPDISVGKTKQKNNRNSGIIISNRHHEVSALSLSGSSSDINNNNNNTIHMSIAANNTSDGITDQIITFSTTSTSTISPSSPSSALAVSSVSTTTITSNIATITTTTTFTPRNDTNSSDDDNEDNTPLPLSP
jgi:hypothetical protein